MSFPAVHPDTLSNIIGFLKSRITEVPDVGIICGSGLGGLASTIPEPRIVIKYEDIPGFPRSTVHGHAGELVFGYIAGKYVVCMKGRFHFYEGWEASQVTLPVRVMAALGIKMMIVTNAAGGVNKSYNVGDIMILEDHVNFLGLAGAHPLRGFNDDRFGPRFPAMNNVYNSDFIAQLKANAKETKFGPGIHQGTYYGFSGPTYETPHEIELVRVCKGDAVGMSTVSEVSVAAHCGIPCLGMSLITNKCLGPGDDPKNAPNHEEVLEATKGTEAHLVKLVIKFISALDLAGRKRPKAYDHFVANPPSFSADYTPPCTRGGGKKEGCPGKNKSGGCMFSPNSSSYGCLVAVSALALAGGLYMFIGKNNSSR